MRRTNKKVEENRKREEHRKQLQEVKRRKRREAPRLERAEPVLQEKERFLIVCEGANTEPSYFRQFRLSSAVIRAVGEGYNTTSLVERAEKLAQQDEYDQVWCVFDKDSFTPNNFNNAITMATQKGMRVAYSNQAFEYWLILHFEDHQGGAMSRRDYISKLNDYLSAYGLHFNDHSKKVTEPIFEMLLAKDEQTDKSRLALAKVRAKRNYDRFDHHSPAMEESSTLVFALVAEMERFI